MRGETAIFRSRMKVGFQFFPHLVVVLRRDGIAKFIVTLSKKMVARFAQSTDSHHVEAHEFDKRFGTETATSIPRWKIHDVLSPNRLHATNYVPSREKDVLMLFRMLPINPGEYTCIDFGSGKGKVLLLAAEFGFKRAVGVEFSPSLHAIATANVDRYKRASKRDCEIECVCQDAAEYTIPQDNLVIFLYGPFYEPVFLEIVKNLRRSLEALDRPVYVVNFGSPLAKAIDKIDFLKPLPGEAGRWVYSNSDTTLS